MMTLFALSVFASQQAPSKGFANWQESLKAKTSISAKVNVQEVGGSSSSYTIDLKKPAMLRLDTTDRLIIADGTTITTFEKKEGVFYKQPQTKEDMKVLLDDDKFALFTGFFGDAPAAIKTEDGASRTLAGDQVKEVKAYFDKAGKKQHTFYVGSDNIAKRSSLTAAQKGSDKPIQMVINAKDLVVNGTPVDTLFAFNAPANAKEINYADLISNKWFFDLEEAKLVASRTGKNIFIDFMADWCGPCKMMDAQVFGTDEFKALGKKLVFCKVNIDLNPSIAEKFGVEAIPNMFVIKPDGTVVGSILGFSPAAEFIPQLEGLAGK